MNAGTVWALVAGCAAGRAAAQSAGLTLETLYEQGLQTVKPQAPFAVVRMGAFFPPDDFAFASARWSVEATDGTWMGALCIPPLTEPIHCGSLFVGGPMLPNLVRGQLHFPPQIVGNRVNPVAFMEARWTTEDFRPRRVWLRTVTRSFDTYVSPASPQSQSRMGIIREATAEILVGECPADCDTSSGLWTLDIFDFICFQNRFATGAPYACDCDTSTGPNTCDIFDFLCFQTNYALGCP